MRTPPPFDLSGRAALVTGAGSPTGIGYAAARLLGDLGASLTLAATTDRVHERAAELGARGIPTLGVVGDLTREEDASSLVAQAYAAHGRLDILVANAGMVSALDGDYLAGSIDETDPQRWRASLARNLDTAYLTCRAALPHLRASGAGRIILVSSVTGAAMAMRGEVAYAAAKAALVGLARALSVDEARHGVTVNVVAPGWIATGSQTPGEVTEGELVPAGRSGTADEIAAAIAFLASPGAAYITGQVLLVDGGNSIAEERRTPGP
ncbi:SDR family NAD(P)-dependent oxidoreductase [Nostocoides veronense]|uniref:SDR family NAD(P)-dependent oxidoreductase n=1 Tax=Nostocoides veronense TaxID=330836 RepID=A0ABP4XPP1_9MICO